MSGKASGAGDGPRQGPLGKPAPAVYLRSDVLAGAMFLAVALAGFYLVRDLPPGTLNKMGSGFFPRLACWALLLLGSAILVQGLLAREEEPGPPVSRAIVLIPASMVAFGYTIETYGLVAAIVVTTGIGSLAAKDLRPLEVAGMAVGMATICTLIFVWGLGLNMTVWPGG